MISQHCPDLPAPVSGLWCSLCCCHCQWGAQLGVRFHSHPVILPLSSFIQNISTGLAVAGVIVIARSIRLITKFQAASEIPARFIVRNVSLRGKVHSVTEEGIKVEHVPIYVPVLSPLLSKHKGVELTPEGKLWLQKNLTPAQTVWLKLISREDNALNCLVSQSKGSAWSFCTNEELLRLGLARSAPIIGAPPDSRLYWRLHRRLHRAEVKAERKCRGLWKQESLWERTSKGSCWDLLCLKALGQYLTSDNTQYHGFPLPEQLLVLLLLVKRDKVLGS
uniref:TNase-like domain-containing protein n=1 Tax=Kryptolebias marmoratus TaxID=37003 RepID=A0A3Q3B9W7_KRYMA